MQATIKSALEFAQAQDMTTQQAISAAILIVKERHQVELSTAMDAVLGQGAWQNSVDDLWEAFNA